MDWKNESKKFRSEAGYGDYQPLEPFVTGRTLDRSMWYEGQLLVFYANADETNSTCAVWEGNTPEGMGPPPHLHMYEHEMFFIIDGHLKAWVEGVEYDVPKDHMVFMPAGRIHWFVSAAPVTRLFCITVTADKRFPAVNRAGTGVFKALGRPAEAMTLPGEIPTYQPDTQRLKEELENTGFRLVDVSNVPWNRAYGDPKSHKGEEGFR